MNHTLLQQDISQVLGLDGLTDEEKVVFLSNVGDVVLEAALIRLVADLSDDQQEALDQFLDTKPDPDVLLKHLLEHHANFETILEEEIASFKAEAIAVLGEPKAKAAE